MGKRLAGQAEGGMKRHKDAVNETTLPADVASSAIVPAIIKNSLMELGDGK